MKELVNIQFGLYAPKNRRNDFGKYQYRSAEDILAAVKPLLKEQSCLLTLSDKLIELGGNIYIEATATITNSEKESVTVTAYAREAQTKAGMDVAQITGSASSYARKYALSGLLAIDNEKDPDMRTCADWVDSAKADIANASDKASLLEVYNYYKNLKGNADFDAALQKRKKELNL